MIKDGGPAFPCPPVEVTCSDRGDTYKDVMGGQDGMSLRDYFAARICAVLCNHTINHGAENGKGLREDARQCAVIAYTFADAMLEEREREPEA